MVKKHFCDRCEKEIESPFEDAFDESFSSISLETKFTEPLHLCAKCMKEYKKIMKDFLKKK